MPGNLIDKVLLELRFRKGRWPSQGFYELSGLPEVLRLPHTLEKQQVFQNRYRGCIGRMNRN